MICLMLSKQKLWSLFCSFNGWCDELLTVDVCCVIFNSFLNLDEFEPYIEEDEILFRKRRAALNFYQTGHKLQGEMSKTLDQLLGPNYNKRIRPNYGSLPVLVELNLSVRSIVSFQLFSAVFSCFFFSGPCQ